MLIRARKKGILSQLFSSFKAYIRGEMFASSKLLRADCCVAATSAQYLKGASPRRSEAQAIWFSSHRKISIKRRLPAMQAFRQVSSSSVFVWRLLALCRHARNCQQLYRVDKLYSRGFGKIADNLRKAETNHAEGLRRVAFLK